MIEFILSYMILSVSLVVFLVSIILLVLFYIIYLCTGEEKIVDTAIVCLFSVVISLMILLFGLLVFSIDYRTYKEYQLLQNEWETIDCQSLRDTENDVVKVIAEDNSDIGEVSALCQEIILLESNYLLEYGHNIQFFLNREENK